MVKVRERIWVGIDVGKASHHACAVDETGKVVFSAADRERAGRDRGADRPRRQGRR